MKKTKLTISGIGLCILILSCSSIFFYNDAFTLFKIQVPIMMISGYFMATFLASYILDRRIFLARSQNLDTINPYKTMIQILPYVNWFIFGFFGVMCFISILVLVFLA